LTRNIFLYALIVVILAACGNKNPANKPDPGNRKDTSEAIKTPQHIEPVKINSAIKKDEYETGLALVSNSDCFTCHKMNEKLVGPSFQDIADLYPITRINIDTLAEKIISGGVGKWGTIPMLPHTTISKDSARKMIKYIFALKNN
jgi:cytochrome c